MAVNHWGLNTVYDVVAKIRDSEPGGMSHACELETSMYLAINPDLVDMSQAVSEIDPWPTQSIPAYSTGELRHLARTEWVVHLDDLLLRRTGIAFRGAATPEAVAEIAAAVAPVFGWDDGARDAEAVRALASVRAAEPATLGR